MRTRYCSVPSLLVTALTLVALASAGPAPGATFQVISFGLAAVVDPTHLLSPPALLSPVTGADGLARHPASGQLYVTSVSGTSSLIRRLDFATGVLTTVGTISGHRIVDLAFDTNGNLLGLSSPCDVSSPSSLFQISTGNAAATLLKQLNNHGGNSVCLYYTGTLAVNPGNGKLYYASYTSSGGNKVFIDEVAPVTFAQTPVLNQPLSAPPMAMTFSAGKLWLVYAADFYSADAANIGGGLTPAGELVIPSLFGPYPILVYGMVESGLACTPSPNAACLAGRFKVEVTYDATPSSGAGPATVVLESNDSVKFSFFDPANIELIVKVLAGCPLNSKWWIFGGGLTSVGVTIKVTDTRTGLSKTYTNTKGALFKTFADTSAFACP